MDLSGCSDEISDGENCAGFGSDASPKYAASMSCHSDELPPLRDAADSPRSQERRASQSSEDTLAKFDKNIKYAAEMQCSDSEKSAQSPTSEQARQARESCVSVTDVNNGAPTCEFPPLDDFLVPTTSSPEADNPEEGRRNKGNREEIRVEDEECGIEAREGGESRTLAAHTKEKMDKDGDDGSIKVAGVTAESGASEMNREEKNVDISVHSEAKGTGAEVETKGEEHGAETETKTKKTSREEKIEAVEARKRNTVREVSAGERGELEGEKESEREEIAQVREPRESTKRLDTAPKEVINEEVRKEEENAIAKHGGKPDEDEKPREEEVIEKPAPLQVRKIPNRVKISFKEIVNKADDEVSAPVTRSPRMTGWEARQKRIENRIKREKMLEDMAKQTELEHNAGGSFPSAPNAVGATNQAAAAGKSNDEHGASGNQVQDVKGSVWGSEVARTSSSEQVVIDLSSCQPISEKPRSIPELVSEHVSETKEKEGTVEDVRCEKEQTNAEERKKSGNQMQDASSERGHGEKGEIRARIDGVKESSKEGSIVGKNGEDNEKKGETRTAESGNEKGVKHEQHTHSTNTPENECAAGEKELVASSEKKASGAVASVDKVSEKEEEEEETLEPASTDLAACASEDRETHGVVLEPDTTAGSIDTNTSSGTVGVTETAQRIPTSVGTESPQRKGKHYKIEVFSPKESDRDGERGPLIFQLACVDPNDTDGDSEKEDINGADNDEEDEGIVKVKSRKVVSIATEEKVETEMRQKEREPPAHVDSNVVAEKGEEKLNDDIGDSVEEVEKDISVCAPSTRCDEDEDGDGWATEPSSISPERTGREGLVINTDIEEDQEGDDGAMRPSISTGEEKGASSPCTPESRVEERMDTLEDEVLVIRKKLMSIEMGGTSPKAKVKMVTIGCQTDQSLMDAYIARLVLRTDVEDMSTQTEFRVDRRKSSFRSVTFSLPGEMDLDDRASECSGGVDGRRLSIESEEEEELASAAKQIENAGEYNAEMDLYKCYLAECEQWVQTANIFTTTVRHLGPEGGIEQANLFGARARKHTMIRHSGTMDEWRWWATSYLSTWSTKTDASSDSHRESIPEPRLLDAERVVGDNEDATSTGKAEKTETTEKIEAKLDLTSLTQKGEEEHEESDWVTVWSPEYGRCYYWNPVSDEVTWVQPVEDN